MLEGYALRQRLEGEEVEVSTTSSRRVTPSTLLVHAWRGRHDAGGARLLDLSAGHAARSLRTLLAGGGPRLTREWHAAAGTRSVVWAGPESVIDLARRHRLMGSGCGAFL